jgi:parallel beta-helix repeat protein
VLLMSTRFFRDVSANLKRSAERPALTQKHATIRIHATDRSHFISLTDGFELNSSYQKGLAGSSNVQDGYEPTALAAADFDEDGTPDLVNGYAGSGGGLITIHRGNVDSRFPNSPEAQQRKATGQFTDSPYLPGAKSFQSPAPPDFIGAGDFNADGHHDLVTASRGDHSLYFFAGDGRGNLAEPKKIDLPGNVTAMTAGEVNREDGLTDIIVGVAAAANDGPRVLIFQSPQGALHDAPTTVFLPAEPTALALGHLRGGYEMDLAIGAGTDLVLVPGRDPFLDQTQPVAAPLQIEQVPFSIRAIALGNFTPDQKGAPDMALLGDDGQIRLADITTTSNTGDKTQSRLTAWSQFQLKEAMAQTSSTASQLIAARVSDSTTDDLIVIDPSNRQLQVVSRTPADASAKSESPAITAAQNFVSATLDADNAPRAVLAARLNSDALSDLVVASQGKFEPSIIFTAAAHTFTVNSNGNEPDADPNDDICSDCQRDGSGNCMKDVNNQIILNNVCSFAAAVTQANKSAGADLINFNLSGNKTISPPSVTITDAVTIDGTSQGRVELNGSSASSGAFFINASASSSTLMGLVINHYPGHAIAILGGSGDVIQGNYIGLNAAGTEAVPNTADGIDCFATNTTIGGTTAAARNVIGGDLGDEIHMEDPSVGALIEGNYISTDATGTLSLGGTWNPAICAVRLLSNNETLGGTDAGARNIIAGHVANGVGIQDAASGCKVQGNYIGLNASGAALPNGPNANLPNGILVNAPGNLIGGTTPAARNIISATTGTNGVGLKFGGTTAINNVVQGNYIGTDPTGMTAVPNNDAGIQFFGGAGSTTIGGATPGSANVISGNLGPGITLAGNGAGNIVQGNLIGIASDNSKSLGNGKAGLNFQGVSNTTVGGAASGAGNIIANNGAQGVRIDTGINNNIQRNSIFNNGALGIDLAPPGVTLNDADDSDDGPNHLQNFPLLGDPVIAQDGSTKFQVSFQSLPGASYRIDFYSNTTGDPSNHGQGQTFLLDKTISTNAQGAASFLFTSNGPLPANTLVSATATDANGNTSEFSCLDGRCCADIPAGTKISGFTPADVACIKPYTVNVTSDDDDALPGDHNCLTDVNDPKKPCSLRAAITEAINDGGNTINFNIPATDAGCNAQTRVCTISPTKALPAINQKLIIDATTQPGFGSSPLIELNGAHAGAANGIDFQKGSQASVLKGFVINGWANNQVNVDSSDQTRISSNYLGLKPDGVSAAGSLGATGVRINVANATVGGPNLTDGNVISNFANGIDVISSNANIGNNKIGTDITGTKAVPNGVGIELEGIPFPVNASNIINNLISGNQASGILAQFTQPAVIDGNLIGVAVDGKSVLSNGGGIRINGDARYPVGSNAPGAWLIAHNTIGGSVSGQDSASSAILISTNSDAHTVDSNFIGINADGVAIGSWLGVVLEDSSNTTISNNWISNNTNAGIYVFSDQFGDAQSTQNKILNNHIGLDPKGVKTAGNSAQGILINGKSLNSEIGNNVISNNKLEGILIAADANGVPDSFSIHGNQVAGNGTGIRIVGSSNNTVTTNILTNNTDFGILVGNSIPVFLGTGSQTVKVPKTSFPSATLPNANTNQIVSNDESGSKCGLAITEGAHNNTIGGAIPANSFSNNTAGVGYGIFIGTTNTVSDLSVMPSGNDVLTNFVNGNINGLVISQAQNNIIGGDRVAVGNFFDANKNDGVELYNEETIGNLLAFNQIGVDSSNPNDQTRGNGHNGVSVSDTGRNDIKNNSIAYNQANGISLFNQIFAPTADYLAVISGNQIGVNGRNAQSGIRMEDCRQILIGVAGAFSSEPRNVIANNGGDGVYLLNSAAITITNSDIGASAGNALANTGNGITIEGGHDNVIGANQAVGNLISGNTKTGIAIHNSPGNRILGNSIGVAFGGGADLANGGDGIAVSDADHTQIGDSGVLFTFGNIIGGNGGVGISLKGPSTVASTVVRNYVGSDGSNNQLGNSGAGIYIADSASKNNVGLKNDLNSGNVIAFNGGPGVWIDTSAACCNLVDPNSIHDNKGLGLQLGTSTNALPNDPGDADSGPNNLQNYPEIISCQLDASGNLNIQYKVDSAPAYSDYGANGLSVEFFKADSTMAGKTFLGSTNYTAGEYAAGTPGVVNFVVQNAASLGVTGGDQIVATATDAAGNTSEFTSTLVGQVSTQSPTSGVQFTSSSFSIGEGAGFATVAVSRTGDTSGAASVRYATNDGTAKEGRDYTAAFGLLNFAAGETSKSFPLLIIDNAFVDGARTVNVTLASPNGTSLTTQSDAAVNISDNDASAGANPIDQTRFFVQLHYYDFLSRYPDQSGWDFWTNNISACTPQPSCTDVQRINTSAAYFLSIEFQQTGYLVERTYKAAYGDAPGASTLGGAHQLAVPVVRFAEFLSDTQDIGRGVVVLQTGWEQALEANKQAYTLAFVQRSRFAAAFSNTLTPAQFVDQLFKNAGVTPVSADRDAAIAEFGGASNTSDVAARSRAVRRVAENSALTTAEFNRAFVLMQYFGYLRRDPNSGPDTDYTGYDFWLTKLNQFNGNYIDSEMVKAFISAIEYRGRFAP